jgi:hypothetical protein
VPSRKDPHITDNVLYSDQPCLFAMHAVQVIFPNLNSIEFNLVQVGNGRPRAGRMHAPEFASWQPEAVLPKHENSTT